MCSHVFRVDPLRLCHVMSCCAMSCRAVQVFDLRDGQQVSCFQAAADTVNGVSFNPCLPLLATASGHRRYPLLPTDGWEADDTSAAAAAVSSPSSSPVTSTGVGLGQKRERSDAAAGLCMASYREGGSCNSLRLWRLHAEWLPLEAPTEVAAEGGDEGHVHESEAAGS